MPNISPEEIAEFIIGLDLDIKIKNFDISKKLKDQSVDSLDLMSILFNLEERYQVKIPDESLEAGQFESIELIAKTLNKLLVNNRIDSLIP